MKLYNKILLTVFSAGLLTLGTGSVTQAQYDNGYDNSGYNNNYDNQNYNNQGQVGFDDFHEQLSPYGRWVNEPNYGQVWVANVANFQPYSSNGYWTYTDYGWTWVSNYDWGWAPFHYGRWGHSNRIGWFWVPGYQWGPAWVTWSSASDMYGWAPLRPGMNFGVNISIGSFPASYWTFMPRRYMGYHNQYSYYVNRSRYNTIIRHTRIINNYGRRSGHRYSMGPQRREVERSTGRAVRQVRVVNSRSRKNTGLRNNELHVYRPSTRSRSNSKATPARRSTNSRSSDRSDVRRKTPARSNTTPSTRQRSERATRSKATPQSRSSAARNRQQNARRSEANARAKARTEARTQAARKKAAEQQQARSRQQHARQQKAQQQSRQRAQKAQQSRQRAQKAQQSRERAQQSRQRAQRSKARVQRSAPARSQQRSTPTRSQSRSSSGRASRGR